MVATDRVDCVVVGYNDVDFSQFAARQKQMADYSGAYQEVKANSILLDGRRVTYMDLLNRSLEAVTGHNPQLNGFKAPNLGACLLTNMLRRHGLKAELVNFFNGDLDRFEELLEAGARSVAITTTYYTDRTPIEEVVRWVRERSPETRIIVGGPHAYNICTDYDVKTRNMILNEIGADVYIYDSQGELTLSRVVDQLRQNGSGRLEVVPNLVYSLGGDGFQATPREPENNPMDEIAIDWSSFDPSLFAPTTYMRTARSCPFSCAFCNYPTLAGKHELTSLQVIERELRYLHESGVKHLVFIDDTFNVPLPRFKQICRMMIENRFDFRWVSFFRCSNSDDEAFDLMAESGCMGVLLGIESGDQRLLKLMNKAVKVERYWSGIRKLKERGILTYALFFVGYPGETEESVRNTTDFILDRSPDFFLTQLYYHDTKVPIHGRAEELGIQGAGYNWRHNTMDWRQAAAWCEHIYHTVADSTILPLYGIGLWTIPYLVDNGISIDRFKRFARIASKMLVRSLDDVPVDFGKELAEIQSLFAGAQGPP